MSAKSTTIRVNYSTKDRLRDFIKKDTVSMDSIILNLIQYRKEHQCDK